MGPWHRDVSLVNPRPSVPLLSTPGNSPRKQEGQEVYCLSPLCGKRGSKSPERPNESPQIVQ